MAKYRILKRTEKSRNIDHRVNEDKYLFAEYSFMNDEKFWVMIVADGMGGLSDGDQASYRAVRGFAGAIYQKILDLYLGYDAENFSLTYYADKVEKAIKEAFTRANQEICEHADPFVETGTTLSVLVVLGSYAVIANMGDSPIYYYRKETDEFTLVSELHTLAELEAKNGCYERFSEEYYSKDHQIYRSLGFTDHLDAEEVYSKVIGYVASGDFFLIGSDGAFGRMGEEEIFQIMGQENEQEVLKNLFERAREDKNDDQTAILFKVC